MKEDQEDIVKPSADAIWQDYMVSALQNLVIHHETSLPAGFTIKGSGSNRRLLLDWDMIATGLAPPSGSIEAKHPTLLALQVVMASPAFEDVCPFTRARLGAFMPLVQPAFPSVLTSHAVEIPGRITLGDIDRFDRLRIQLSRLLRARPRARTLLRREFETLLASYVQKDAEGARSVITRLALPPLIIAAGIVDTSALADTICTIPMNFRTTYAEELGALMRRERYGVVVDSNYVVIRHVGVASDVLASGDRPAWLRAATMAETVYDMKLRYAAIDLRDWLRDTFKVLGLDASERLFKRIDALRSTTFNPAEFTVIYRAEATEYVNRAKTLAAKPISRGERPPRRRRIKEVTVPVPDTFKGIITTPTMMLCRRKDLVYFNIDGLSDIRVERLVNLPAKDFVAYDANGDVCYRFRDVPATLYISLSVLGAHLKQPELAAYLYERYGSGLSWQKAFDAATDVKRRKRAKAYPFTIAEDTYLALYARKWKRADFWADFLTRFPHHTQLRLRRRASFVRAVMKARSATVKQLHDVTWLDENIKGLTLKKWKSIYKAIEELQ